MKPTFHEKCVPAAVSYFRAPYWKSNPGPIVRGGRHDNILFSLSQTPAYNIEVKMEGSPQKSDIFCVLVAHSISLKKKRKTKSRLLIKVICVNFWPEIVLLFSFLKALNSIKGMGWENVLCEMLNMKGDKVCFFVGNLIGVEAFICQNFTMGEWVIWSK